MPYRDAAGREEEVEKGRGIKERMAIEVVCRVGDKSPKGFCQDISELARGRENFLKHGRPRE